MSETVNDDYTGYIPESGVIKATGNPIPVSLNFDYSEIENLVGMAYVQPEGVVLVKLSDAGRGAELRKIFEENSIKAISFAVMYIAKPDGD